MGKKSSQSSTKISKHEKKQQLNSLIKILRPKVYITDPSNFKKLVQELTGNGKYSPVESSPPPPSTSVSLSQPLWEVPFSETEDHHHHNNHLQYQENSSFDVSFESSCLTGSLNCEMGNLLDSQKMDFYKDLEAMLMEADTGSCDYDPCYGMFQQDQVCVYDYDLSTFI